MKKLLFALTLMFCIISCGGNSTQSNQSSVDTVDTVTVDTVDSIK